MARAMDWALDRDAGNGGAFLAVNAGSNGWNYQVRELARAVADLVPDVRLSVNPNAAPDNRSYRVDFTLFQRLAPSHQPKVNLSDAICEIRDGLAAMKFHDANFRGSQYMRLEVLRQLTGQGLLDHDLRWTFRMPRERGSDEKLHP
jgi:hypothetical protein